MSTDINLTPTQSKVLISNAHEIAFHGTPGCGKTFVAMTKLVAWLQEDEYRTGVFTTRYIGGFQEATRILTNEFKDIGLFNATDKSFVLHNGSLLWLLTPDEVSYEHIGGIKRGSFVFDCVGSDTAYEFAKVKRHKKGFILTCFDSPNTILTETTYIQSKNPHLKD